MFDPDDLEPKIKYKPQPKPQTRPITQAQPHKKQPYSGNGPTFDVRVFLYTPPEVNKLNRKSLIYIKDWLKSKKSAPKIDETDKEAEERKAKELRQLMAEEKLKEWLSEKIKPGFKIRKCPS